MTPKWLGHATLHVATRLREDVRIPGSLHPFGKGLRGEGGYSKVASKWR